MNRFYLASAPILFAAGVMVAGSAGAQRQDDPIKFFEGRTESVSIIKVITKKPFSSRSIGRGQIAADGTLTLVQRVEEEGRPPFDRRWRIHRVAPGRYVGTMSEAKGPVTIDEVRGRYRFRYKMKGSLSIEQWLTPLPDGRSAKTSVTIRKLGLTVGSSEGIIKRLPS